MFNEQEYEKIVALADRSKKIGKLIKDGKTLEEIVEATKSYPNIVRYYQRRLLK